MGSCLECQAEEFGFVLSDHGKPFGVRSDVLLEEEWEAQSLGFLGLPLSLSAGAFCPQSHHHLSK